MEGWVSPAPGCKEQLAHGCYATARGQRDSNPDVAIVSRPRYPLGYCVTEVNDLNDFNDLNFSPLIKIFFNFGALPIFFLQNKIQLDNIIQMRHY